MENKLRQCKYYQSWIFDCFKSYLCLVHSKYVGTGHPDISRQYVHVSCHVQAVNISLWCFDSEFLVTQQRDSIATYIGHPNMLSYMALAKHQSIERTRSELLLVRWHYALAFSSACLLCMFNCTYRKWCNLAAPRLLHQSILSDDTWTCNLKEASKADASIFAWCRHAWLALKSSRQLRLCANALSILE